MGAEIYPEDFSKEEMRRHEIRARLEALEIAKPLILEFQLLACSSLAKIKDEIKSLEEESDAIRQGQLLLD